MDEVPEQPKPFNPDDLPPALKLAFQMGETQVLAHVATAITLATQVHGSPEAAFTRVREMISELEGGYAAELAEQDMLNNEDI